MEPQNVIRNCTVHFRCPQLWTRLATTDDPKVRFCDSCTKPVYLVQNEEELAEQSSHGRCVAILNLSPEHEAFGGNCVIGEIGPDWLASDRPK
jgi:hypothetical protein